MIVTPSSCNYSNDLAEFWNGDRLKRLYPDKPNFTQKGVKS